MITTDILGSEWIIEERNKTDDVLCKDGVQVYDGYADDEKRKIYIVTGLSDRYYREVLRHEIIHAYLFESGLDGEIRYPEHGHDEQMIDWFAIQYPKITRTYNELSIDY